MPRFYFHVSPTQKVHWHFDRYPEIGEVIALGAPYGWCRVTKSLPSRDATVDAEYAVEQVTPMTKHEEARMTQGDGPFQLPPRD